MCVCVCVAERHPYNHTQSPKYPNLNWMIILLSLETHSWKSLVFTLLRSGGDFFFFFLLELGNQDSKKPSQEAGPRLTQTALLNSGLLLGFVDWGGGGRWGVCGSWQREASDILAC